MSPGEEGGGEGEIRDRSHTQLGAALENFEKKLFH
jgi:hypothetical protein